MMQHRLLDELDKVAARYRMLRFWQALAAAWLLAALVGLGVLAVKSAGGGLPLAVPAIVLAALVLAGVGVWLAVTSARNPLWTARRIEAAYPELRTCLLAAVEQRPDLPGGRFGYLQANVIHQALLHAHRQKWERIVPTRRIAWAFVANAASLSLLVVVLFAIGFAAGTSPEAVAALAGTGQLAGSGQFSVTVEPGDTEVEKGTSLLVLARVTGDIPAESTLVYSTAGGEETRLAMSRSLNDPLFGKSIAGVSEPLVYHVEIGGQTTPEYRVGVFEYPRLERADAKLAYPKYTGLAERLVQDVRTVTVVEGTELTLICYLNKPVAKATLIEDQAPPIELAAVPASDKPAWQAKITCDRTRRVKLHLLDDAGRKNVQLPSFTINVTPNRPVALKPVFPARDLEASPLEEIDARATAWDDFGVARFGVTYALAGEEPVEVVLGEKAAARERHELVHTMKLEDLQAEPDELFSYHWWAEDLDAAGQARRVESDMYFAEVRHFEEIFRQGEQPPGGEQQQQQQGQGQNAQQAQQLAQLQKQIINATWKLIRREVGGKLSEAFAGDVEQIVQSQQTALEQATALAGRVQDAESQEHVAAVLTAMQQAVTHLTAAHGGPAREPLQPALAAEQAAYQALLKLRAREHRVIRQQRQQQQQRGSQSQQSRSQEQQRQMNQLDLQQERNPYETQRLAQDQQQQETPEAREDRQVLNRLRELARRQHDLNERLKELQSALEEARTQEQKEEIRRQLKRLQDEQRQVLDDTDELQARMEQPENQERMAEERQQLEETREQVRRSSEALEQEMVTQAAASGTRAEREFEDLRNEFRRRNSGRFNEEMRDMREAARELDQRQQQLGEQLAQNDDQQNAEQQNPREQKEPQERDGDKGKAKSSSKGKGKSKSLSDGNDDERTAEELAQQRERLANLQEQMRQTIAEAEETEPLLTERLYEAARGVEERQLDQELRGAENSVRRGLADDARQREESARRGIGQLREGVERAAEAVLGDEAEALRRAREELENLSRELNQEIARNNPDSERQPEERQPGQQQQNGQQRPGQQQDGQRQPGQQQQQDGQRQPGQQQQDGQRQPGQQQQDGQRQPGQQQDGQRQPGQQQQDGQRQPGEQQQQDGQRQPGQQQQDGQRRPGQQRSGERNDRGGRRLDDVASGGNAEMFDRDADRQFAPLTGEEFREWSDRLRDVEEMVDDPELRAEAARIRDRARAVRAEFKRHSATPQWDLVQDQIAEPLVQLKQRVAEELLRRTSREAIVPLDRDPVPPQYTEKTRQYYERLGTGK
jgi:hypothetical protein